ncbi:hypothetical protein P7K49_013762 [Saguinus oedipus]|uniref:Uncharacterized protein n=1 Tax=Saguinus oedipus TaxID=9490 RepID=A0ABQ9VH92_SAGOE|nr:hypothetical protein P7K49_013762 [Saguinus oedipus]
MLLYLGDTNVSGKGPDGNAHSLRFEGMERQYASLPSLLSVAHDKEEAFQEYMQSSYDGS